MAFLGWVLLSSTVQREVGVSAESGANQLGGLQRSAEIASTEMVEILGRREVVIGQVS